MGKLMKYEWKKQRTSRMIVMVALAVCVLTFLGGMLVEKDALMGISATLLLVGSFFVVFYMGIESILILNRDLKTKQSYMIWMTPKSVWEILGAKFVVAIVQMFFVFALYVIAGLLCFVGMLQYVGELGNVFAIIRDSFIRVSGEGQLIAQIIWNLFCIFVGWIEVVMVGYLAVGGSGAGKSRTYAIPNIMQCNCSMVITDPKAGAKRSYLKRVGTALH